MQTDTSLDKFDGADEVRGSGDLSDAFSSTRFIPDFGAFRIVVQPSVALDLAARKTDYGQRECGFRQQRRERKIFADRHRGQSWPKILRNVDGRKLDKIT